MKQMKNVSRLSSCAILLASFLLGAPALALEPRIEPGAPPSRLERPAIGPDLIAVLDSVHKVPQSVTVRNRGNKPAAPSVLKFSCRPSSVDRVCAGYAERAPLLAPVPALGPGEEHTAWLDSSFSDLRRWACDQYTFVAVADANNQVREINEQNNRHSRVQEIACTLYRGPAPGGDTRPGTKTTPQKEEIDQDRTRSFLRPARGASRATIASPQP